MHSMLAKLGFPMRMMIVSCSLPIAIVWAASPLWLISSMFRDRVVAEPSIHRPFGGHQSSQVLTKRAYSRNPVPVEPVIDCWIAPSFSPPKVNISLVPSQARLVPVLTLWKPDFTG